MCEMAQNKILSKCANRTRIPTESTHMTHKCSRFKSWWSGLHSWQNFLVDICVFCRTARQQLADILASPPFSVSLHLTTRWNPDFGCLYFSSYHLQNWNWLPKINALSLNFQQQQKKDRSAWLLKNLLGKYWSASVSYVAIFALVVMGECKIRKTFA